MQNIFTLKFKFRKTRNYFLRLPLEQALFVVT